MNLISNAITGGAALFIIIYMVIILVDSIIYVDNNSKPKYPSELHSCDRHAIAEKITKESKEKGGYMR